MFGLEPLPEVGFGLEPPPEVGFQINDLKLIMFQIVIFDEGHNIESQCTDGASYSVNQIELG